ncbi:unnamed protein product [Gordionus sp. m RMFG-2023]|uniref:uncharacterized protein LOC135929830 isoform X1 n=1 Tax=Gordionus sp. m RMFG-2023 TaxID=3053472 RepID=UPI0030DF0F7B
MKFETYTIAFLVILGLVDYSSGTPTAINRTYAPKDYCSCPVYCFDENDLDTKGCPACACNLNHISKLDTRNSLISNITKVDEKPTDIKCFTILLCRFLCPTGTVNCGQCNCIPIVSDTK